MLAFLDALCQALCARDGDRIRRHLHHPLARALPPAVRAEVLAIARGAGSGHLPPTRTLHFYYQTLQLRGAGDPAPDEVNPTRGAPRAPATVRSYAVPA